MTDAQKQAIIAAFNAAHERQVKAEGYIDKGLRGADNQHSFALGEQSGIDRILDLMGYTLVVDDEERAIDIMED